MLTHYRRRRNEPRGDEYDAWGGSDWYFEIDEDSYAVRQIEVYDAGRTLRYGLAHDEDEYGSLTFSPFEADEWEPFLISAKDFEQAWLAAANPPKPTAG